MTFQTPQEAETARRFVEAFELYQAGVRQRYGVLDDFTLSHALHADAATLGEAVKLDGARDGLCGCDECGSDQD